MNQKNTNLLMVAWLMATVATLGSLYYSEIRHFTPCKLCWFQRILMYPEAIILGTAAWNNDHRIKRYVLPLSILGMFVSAYHILEQKYPEIFSSSCDPFVPCSTEWIHQFPIPVQAFIAFTIITVCLSLIKVDKQKQA